jgi:hypothetical protein
MQRFSIPHGCAGEMIAGSKMDTVESTIVTRRRVHTGRHTVG